MFSLGLDLLAEKCVFSSYQALNRDVAQRAHRNTSAVDVIGSPRFQTTRRQASGGKRDGVPGGLIGISSHCRARACSCNRSTLGPFPLKDYYYIIRSFRLSCRRSEISAASHLGPASNCLRAARRPREALRRDAKKQSVRVSIASVLNAEPALTARIVKGMTDGRLPIPDDKRLVATSLWSLARPSFHAEAVLASRRMLRRARGTLLLIPRGTGRKWIVDRAN